MKWLSDVLIRNPYRVALCLSEKKYQKELRRMRLARSEWPPFLANSHCDASTCFVLHDNGDSRSCIVSLGDMTGKSQGFIYGLLVHEAVHIWQRILLYIAEARPSEEFEAYAIQHLAQSLMESYEKQKKK